MPISTAGSDLLREESARTTNTLINSVSRGGSRALSDNVGRISAANTDANRRASYDLDRQYQDRNRLIARENSRIQGMYERREEGDLAGLGAKLQADRETTWNGISAMQSGLNYGANNGMFDKTK